MRNKLAHTWTLRHMEAWVEPFLLSHSNPRVRNAAAYLLVALVPSNPFRQLFRSARSMVSPCKEKMMMTEDALLVLHEVYGHLLRILGRAKQYAGEISILGVLCCIYLLSTVFPLLQNSACHLAHPNCKNSAQAVWPLT